MIVNEEEALARLTSPDNLINKLSKQTSTRPEADIDSFLDSVPLAAPKVERNEPNKEDDEPTTVNKVELRELYANRTGTKNVPPIIQTLAVETALVTSERAAGADFGVSHQTVNYYKNGGGKADRNQIKENMSKLHSQALDVMLGSIGVIQEKLDKREIKKATDLSKIAADMSRVIDKTTPKEAGNTNVKVVVFAPNLKSEDQYEEMVVNN